MLPDSAGVEVSWDVLGGRVRHHTIVGRGVDHHSLAFVDADMSHRSISGIFPPEEYVSGLFLSGFPSVMPLFIVPCRHPYASNGTNAHPGQVRAGHLPGLETVRGAIIGEGLLDDLLAGARAAGVGFMTGKYEAS